MATVKVIAVGYGGDVWVCVCLNMDIEVIKKLLSFHFTFDFPPSSNWPFT